MEEILETIKRAAIRISDALKYSDLGYTHNQNSTGDTQLKLDVLSDNIITEEFLKSKDIKALVSEEKEGILSVNEGGKFIVAYDPLDGSSLVDVNFAVGSIFGIYENELCSKNLKAAVYTIYGPRLELVVATDKVRFYRLDRNGEFIYIKDLILQQKGRLNATGATQKGWSDVHRNFIKSLFDEGYRLRYSGAMVSDLHQILLKGGGLFSYPSTSDAINGKLRLAFEVLPFAYIYEKAGGKTSNGKNVSLFEIEFTSPHQTSPCFFGSSYEIDKMHEYYGK